MTTLLNTCIAKELNNAVIHASSSILGSVVFKSTHNVDKVLASWNTDKHKKRHLFQKLSTEKQQELSKHVVIELPFADMLINTVKDYCLLFDNTDNAKYALAFVRCTKQTFPVYGNVEEHVDKISPFFKHAIQKALQIQHPEHVHVINDRCYITAELAFVIFDELSDIVRIILDADVQDLQIQDLTEDTWSVSVLQHDKLQGCSFLLQARRSVLKDFSIHKNCACTCLSALHDTTLNRRANNDSIYLVTVFDIKNTMYDLKHMLAEKSTIDILSKLRELLKS